MSETKHYKISGETEKGLFWTCLESEGQMDVEQASEIIGNKYWVNQVQVDEFEEVGEVEEKIIKFFNWANPKSTY